MRERFQCFHLLRLQKGKKNKPRGTRLLWCLQTAISPVIWFKGIYDLLTESLQSRLCYFLCSLAKKPTYKQRLCVFFWKGAGSLLWKCWNTFPSVWPKLQNDTEKLRCKLRSVCFPRIPHRTEASGMVLIVSISASSLTHSLAIIRSHLAHSMGSTSLLHVSLLLRTESCQYRQLAQEGKEVFSTVLVFLHTWEVKAQKEMRVPH